MAIRLAMQAGCYVPALSSESRSRESVDRFIEAPRFIGLGTRSVQITWRPRRDGTGKLDGTARQTGRTKSQDFREIDLNCI